MVFLLNNNKENLIVHTPGKVGSTSVYVTLKKVLRKTHNVFHFHYLHKNAIDTMWRKNLISKRNSVPLHLIESRHFTDQFDYERHPLSLIVLIREPISRYISATYQNLNMYFEEKYRTDIKDINEFIFEGLKHGNHLKELDWWFKKELLTNFDIDVYKENDLVSRNGYWVFQKNKVKVYIIQMEQLNSVFTEFCENELNLRQIQLIDSNVATDKAYATKYKETKKNLKIPEEIIKRSKSSAFYKRFYST